MRDAVGARRDATIAAPLVWTFDGALATCLGDVEDTLRRVLVQIGDAAAIAVLLELSLPALKQRVDAGDAVQPAWGRCLDNLSTRYGLPSPPRVRTRRDPGPLLTLIVAYRS